MSNKQKNYALEGAIFGGLIAIGIPTAFYVLFAVVFTGSDANIGAGLLFLALIYTLPIYLPIAVWLGWKIGKRVID